MRVTLVAALLFGAMMPALSSGASAPARALWVWSGPVPGALDVAVADGFQTLFVHAPPGFDPAAYEGFVTDAHAAGIEVHAMAGDPAWATERRAWVNWIEEVNDAEMFDGAVVDVEPYLLPEWNDPGSQRRLINSYLRRLAAAQRAADLDLVVAVPFWWDLPEFDRNGESLVSAVVDRADGIIVMAYRDQALGADGIIEHAATEVAVAAADGKSAWVGVETGDAGLDKLSFFEEGRAVMSGELALVDAEFSVGYRGVAVHHYGSWLDLSD